MAVYIHKFDATGVEEGIKRVEEKLNIKIPESYRNFLLKYNGGTTMRASFDIKNEESYILAFMGVANADPYYNIEEEMNRSSNFVFRDRIEKGYLEIAPDSFGNYICIGIKESNYGKIYFYDHEINRYKLLTQTFEEFLEKIESKKFRVKTIEERIADRLELGLETAPDSPFIKMWQEDIEEYKDYTEELIELD